MREKGRNKKEKGRNKKNRQISTIKMEE